jgi:SAM-dependent methyltransferase
MDTTLSFYDSNARDMARRYEEVDFDAPVDRFKQHLSPGARILEIGTGSGRDAARLVSGRYDVVGIDGSAAMIAEAISRHPELRGRLLRHRLPEPLPFDDGGFDGVVSWAVLMHLRREALEAVFRDIGRVTAPEGIFAYSVNTERAGLDEEGHDGRKRRFTCLPATGWERLHRAAGFETIEMIESDDITGRPGIRWVTVYARRTVK